MFNINLLYKFTIRPIIIELDHFLQALYDQCRKELNRKKKNMIQLLTFSMLKIMFYEYLFFLTKKKNFYKSKFTHGLLI